MISKCADAHRVQVRAWRRGQTNMKQRTLTLVLMLLSIAAMAQKHRAKPKPPPPPPPILVDVAVGETPAMLPPFKKRGSFNVVEKDKKTHKWITTRVNYYIHTTDSLRSVPTDLIVDFEPERPITLVAKIVEGDKIINLKKADSTNHYSSRLDLIGLSSENHYAVCLCDASWFCISRFPFSIINPDLGRWFSMKGIYFLERNLFPRRCPLILSRSQHHQGTGFNWFNALFFCQCLQLHIFSTRIEDDALWL